PPRPMTHDLLDRIINKLGAKIEKIVINDLRDHTFFAKIYLSLKGKTVEVDSRPSDAIALGAGSDIPIYVADHIFDKASQ
ncbi:MAG: bifunctional nuclease family protein, partial [Planctomycetota bacterium]